MSYNKKILTLKDTISVLVIENGEKMVLLIADRIKAEYRKNDMVRLLGKNIYVREGVANKLYCIQERLDSKNNDLKLFIVYGYRAPEIQHQYYEMRLFEVKTQFPKLSESEHVERAHAMSAHPDSAGHPTGGAVDITLWDDKHNREVDMGSGIAEFGGLEKTDYPNLTNQQKTNRKFLQDMMLHEGFSPFLGEWWHFSYGDKEWAAYYGKPNALYDMVPLQKVAKSQ